MSPHCGKREGLGAETLASALEREHRRIDQAVDAYLATVDDGRARPGYLRQAIAALRRHIYLEEEFLFPRLRRAGLVAPIFVMLREHGELWRTMESIVLDLSSEETAAEVRAACGSLLEQLERHNSKEEPIVYPHADSVLGAAVSSELRAFLEHGNMPAGWSCAKA